MKCAVEIDSDGMINIPSSMTIDPGIEVTLRLIPQQSERL
jgi:hypothetical protein